jgi:hypothetical protein
MITGNQAEEGILRTTPCERPPQLAQELASFLVPANSKLLMCRIRQCGFTLTILRHVQDSTVRAPS